MSKLDPSVIPIGSIQFVEKFLQTFYNIEQNCPIEVPKFLRLPELLGRKYNIVQVKDLPENGYYFVKSAQHLKSMQYCGSIEHARNLLNPTDWCVYSDAWSNEAIQEEYRVFVYNGKILDVKSYGEYTCNLDYTVIDKTVELMNNNFPINTYSFDVAVVDKYCNDNPHTYIIEVHLVSSLGLYGFNDERLIEMYRDTYRFFVSNVHKQMLENRKLIW